ncbi:MAG: hypothetical protein ACXWR0_19550, partial [Bdellovibrio sp.]
MGSLINFDSDSNNSVFPNKRNLNQNHILISESSVLKNSNFEDVLPVVSKYPNSRQILILFENLQGARADFNRINDFFRQAKNSVLGVKEKSNPKLISLDSISNTLPKLTQEEIMEVDALALPGKGKKFIFKAKINDSDVNVIIDTGSTTTLIRKSLVVDLR